MLCNVAWKQFGARDGDFTLISAISSSFFMLVFSVTRMPFSSRMLLHRGSTLSLIRTVLMEMGAMLELSLQLDRSNWWWMAEVGELFFSPVCLSLVFSGYLGFETAPFSSKPAPSFKRKGGRSCWNRSRQKRKPLSSISARQQHNWTWWTKAQKSVIRSNLQCCIVFIAFMQIKMGCNKTFWSFLFVALSASIYTFQKYSVQKPNAVGTLTSLTTVDLKWSNQGVWLTSGLSVFTKMWHIGIGVPPCSWAQLFIFSGPVVVCSLFTGSVALW